MILLAFHPNGSTTPTPPKTACCINYPTCLATSLLMGIFQHHLSIDRICPFDPRSTDQSSTHSNASPGRPRCAIVAQLVRKDAMLRHPFQQPHGLREQRCISDQRSIKINKVLLLKNSMAMFHFFLRVAWQRKQVAKWLSPHSNEQPVASRCPSHMR